MTSKKNTEQEEKSKSTSGEIHSKTWILSWIVPPYLVLPPFLREIQISKSGLIIKGLFRVYDYSWEEVLGLKMLVTQPRGGEKKTLYIKTKDRIFYFYDTYFLGDWIEAIERHKNISRPKPRKSYLLLLALVFLPLLDKDFQNLILPNVHVGSVFAVCFVGIFLLLCYLDELNTRRINNI